MVKLGQLFRRNREKKDQPEEVDSTAQTQKEDLGAHLGKLGQLLRETREEKRVTLEEIENATRIRLKYLLAIEEGNYDDLPTPGHVHGFLRNYALYLGLDLDEVEALYARDRAAHRGFEPRIFHPQDISLSPRRSWIKADLVLGFVVALVVLVVGGWAFWQYGWPLIQPTPTPTPTPTATSERVVLKPSVTTTSTSVSPTATPVPPTATVTEPTPEPTPTATIDSPLTIATPTPQPTSTPTPAPTTANSVVLKIKVIERSWLQVTVDGQELPGVLFEADEEQEWEGQNSIYMICGNAGGVQVTVNGEELGTLGERGQVVEKTWTPEGELTSTPEVEGTPGGEGDVTPTITPTATTAP